jgi:hypothetical protein
MKFASFAALTMLLLVMLLPGLALAGPKLTIPQPEFDFGYVPQMAKISHDFWLYSTGDDTLRIFKVSPG